jgi:hypothetical protein
MWLQHSRRLLCRYLCIMRFRSLFLLFPVLLGACSKTTAPVRLDFIGATGLTSGSKTVGANDTLVTRAYAEGNDANLARMRVTVKYEPTRNPILYSLPLSSYDPTTAPKDDAIVYADSVIDDSNRESGTNGNPRGGTFLFVNKFSGRSTSGTELWEYTASDVNSQSTTRVYRLTVRKTDSATVYHNYTALLRPPVLPTIRPLTNAARALRDQSRVFLSLRSGLLLPRYSLINSGNTLQGNQPLIDLMCVATSATTVVLKAPTDEPIFGITTINWPTSNRKPTQLRSTGLGTDQFNSAVATADFNRAFTNGNAFSNPLSTSTLVKGQVIAFRVTENNTDYTGMLLVSDLILGTAPRVICSIKVQK